MPSTLHFHAVVEDADGRVHVNARATPFAGAVRSHGGELSKSAAANCFGPVHEDASA